MPWASRPCRVHWGPRHPLSRRGRLSTPCRAPAGGAWRRSSPTFMPTDRCSRMSAPTAPASSRTWSAPAARVWTSSTPRCPAGGAARPSPSTSPDTTAPIVPKPLGNEHSACEAPKRNRESLLGLEKKHQGLRFLASLHPLRHPSFSSLLVLCFQCTREGKESNPLLGLERKPQTLRFLASLHPLRHPSSPPACICVYVRVYIYISIDTLYLLSTEQLLELHLLLSSLPCVPALCTCSMEKEERKNRRVF